MDDLQGNGPPRWRELLDHRGAVIVLAGGVLVGAVNIYLASSLLPTAVAELGGAGFYAWNMTVYLVAMVIGTMLVSRFLARWGNVGAYLAGFVVFVAGSLACALSPSMPLLLAGRGVQGFGAGLLSGLGFAVVRAALPARLWTRGNALMSAMYGIGNFVGPALGGLFAQLGSWRLAFVMMAAAGAACALMVPRVLPRGERNSSRVPVPGVSLALVTAATLAASVAGVLPGTPAKACGVVVALLLVAGLVAHERRSELRVFPRTTYQPGTPLKWIYLTLGLLAFGVAVESFLPLFGQRLGGLAPLAAGFFGAAISLGWSVAQIWSSSAVSESGIRRRRALGPALLAVGLLALGLLQTDNAPIWLVITWVPVLFVAGCGIGVAYPHLSVAAMADGEQAAAAVATVTTLSMAFGAAVAGVLLNMGDSMLDSARYLLFGFAAICALGIFTARSANRPARSPQGSLHD
jgi:MFS family permease